MSNQNEMSGYGSNDAKSGNKDYQQESLLMATDKDTKLAKKYRNTLMLFIVTLLILIGLAIFTIITVVDNNTSDEESTIFTEPQCTSETCYKLANDIISTVNTDVDPCEHFYNYVCDGFTKENQWELTKSRISTTLGSLNTKQKETFLSTFVEETPLMEHESVIKAKTFFDSCYTSEMNEESIQSSALLNQFLSMVNFSNYDINDFNESNINDEIWDENNIPGFQDGMSWMLQRGWDSLFRLYAYDKGVVWFEQKWQEWIDSRYDVERWRSLMNTTFIPLYKSLFNLDDNQAQFIADLVVDFTIQVNSITTADETYEDSDIKETYIMETTFDELNGLFGESNVLDYGKLILDIFKCMDSTCVEDIIYLEPGIQYFNDLITLIENTPPMVIQYWFFTDILDNFFDYGSNSDAFVQSRYTDRRDYCFTLTRNEFKYIYGYIINQRMYEDDKMLLAINITKSVLFDGVGGAIFEVDWLADEESLQETLLKANRMDYYVGLPPTMTDIVRLNEYYGVINNLDMSNGFIQNYDLMLLFDIDIQLSLFRGDEINLHAPWPASFGGPNTGTWLTGVNAFYRGSATNNEKGNWFCMPQTITQIPMFDVEYPLVTNFAAWGYVVGHEITHGFDSRGSEFNWYGNRTEMWSPQTRSNYNESIQCIINQYNNIEVEPGIYCDGLRTNTENTADVGGMAASLRAYNEFKLKNNINIDPNQPMLPGLTYNENQLWWVSFARTWCSVFVPGYYNTTNGNYNGVHGPVVARVNGVAQNFQEFSDAFQCPVGSYMNPENKCGLWHNT